MTNWQLTYLYCDYFVKAEMVDEESGRTFELCSMPLGLYESSEAFKDAFHEAADLIYEAVKSKPNQNIQVMVG